MLTTACAPSGDRNIRKKPKYARHVRTGIEQAVYDVLPHLPIFNLRSKVEWCCLLQAVHRVDVALIVREDVLKHVRAPVLRTTTIPTILVCELTWKSDTHAQ
jgi:hypothetical protein